MKLDEILRSRKFSCAIPHSEISEMLKAITKSDDEGKEEAMSFCGNGQELSFPTATGVTRQLKPLPPPLTHSALEAICPISTDKLGSFHTNPPGSPAKKSVDDWFADMKEQHSISCVGGIEVGLEPGEYIGTPYIERTITCHCFQKHHPDYEDFRQRLLDACFETMLYETELAEKLETRSATDAERVKFRELHDKIDALVHKGSVEGIIRPCTPHTTPAKISVPDVQGMLEEQKEY